MNEYVFGPLGVATTIPAPGTGSAWTYLANLPRFAVAAIARSTVAGRASAALARTPSSFQTAAASAAIVAEGTPAGRTAFPVGSIRLRSPPVRCSHRSRKSAASRTRSKANPGQFTTVRAKFELPSGVTAPQNYVYHCHIVEHEDNDMMRPFTVTA